MCFVPVILFMVKVVVVALIIAWMLPSLHQHHGTGRS